MYVPTRTHTQTHTYTHRDWKNFFQEIVLVCVYPCVFVCVYFDFSQQCALWACCIVYLGVSWLLRIFTRLKKAWMCPKSCSLSWAAKSLSRSWTRSQETIRRRASRNMSNDSDTLATHAKACSHHQRRTFMKMNTLTAYLLGDSLVERANHFTIIECSKLSANTNNWMKGLFHGWICQMPNNECHMAHHSLKMPIVGAILFLITI